MKSLFNPADNKEIIERLNRLTSSTPAQWGKMNVSQMITHCQAPLNLALGNVKAKKNILGLLFGSIIKKMVVDNDKPFKKDLPTDKTFIIKNTPEFEKVKNELIVLIGKFSNTDPEAFSKDRHPIFGKLTRADWDKLTWKHLDHHLRQFGV